MENFIHAENLCCSYRDEEGNRQEILHGVSFDVARGEYVAILGHNGSGKSTLAKLINGILEPDGGVLTVAGKDLSSPDLTDDDIYELRRQVGMVFPLSCCSCTINHVNSSYFTLCLYKCTAMLNHLSGHIMHDFCLRRDRITKIMTASGTDRCFCDNLISLHQNSLCHTISPYLSTVITESGHVVAQNVQPMH